MRKQTLEVNNSFVEQLGSDSHILKISMIRHKVYFKNFEYSLIQVYCTIRTSFRRNSAQNVSYKSDTMIGISSWSPWEETKFNLSEYTSYILSSNILRKWPEIPLKSLPSIHLVVPRFTILCFSFNKNNSKNKLSKHLFKASIEIKCTLFSLCTTTSTLLLQQLPLQFMVLTPL